MLPGMTSAVGGVRGASQSSETTMEVLTSLGFTTNLKLCLDASDGSSYTSGQKWLDRSGGGFDFFLGADGSSTATDPTFNGTAGGRSSGEYFLFDGGDYLTYDSTNETWMNAIHKDSAVATIAGWFYTGNATSPSSDSDSLMATLGAPTFSGDYGFQLYADLTSGAGPLGFGAMTGGSLPFASGETTATMTANAWNFFGASITEASSSLVLAIGNAAAGFISESKSVTYSVVGSSDATHTMKIGAAGNAVRPFSSGRRLASIVAWQGTALSASNLQAIFTATRAKFGV